MFTTSMNLRSRDCFHAPRMPEVLVATKVLQLPRAPACFDACGAAR